MKIRALEVQPDGTAEVMLLTNPIPRAVSLVSWGANNTPAASWKSSGYRLGVTQMSGSRTMQCEVFERPAFTPANATPVRKLVSELAAVAYAGMVYRAADGALVFTGPERLAPRDPDSTYRTTIPPSVVANRLAKSTALKDAQEYARSHPLPVASTSSILRDAPSGDVVDPSRATGSDLSVFITETINAWKSVCVAVMGTALEPADRAARLRAATVQAGARVAAVVHSLGSETQRVAMSVPIPEGPRESPTVDGEVDRVRFTTDLDSVGSMLHGACFEIASSGDRRAVELILSAFSLVADALDAAAQEIPAGVVGVAQKIGKRHSLADFERLRRIRDSIEELLGVIDDAVDGDEPKTSSKTYRFFCPQSENLMTTLKDLELLVDGDPQGFLCLIQRAIAKTDAVKPKTALKFIWGETGVDPYNIDAILGSIPGIQGGLDELIISAVSGIDIDRAMSTSPGVVASMKGAEKAKHKLAVAFKDAMVKSALAEVRDNPNGELAAALRGVVAPSVGNAIAEGVKVALRNYVDGGGNTSGFSFGPEDESGVDLSPELPTINSRR